MAKKPPNPWPKKLKSLREGPPKRTQAEAAAHIRVSLATWSSWELGRRVPSEMAARLIELGFPTAAR